MKHGWWGRIDQKMTITHYRRVKVESFNEIVGDETEQKCLRCSISIVARKKFSLHIIVEMCRFIILKDSLIILCHKNQSGERVIKLITAVLPPLDFFLACFISLTIVSYQISYRPWFCREVFILFDVNCMQILKFKIIDKIHRKILIFTIIDFLF